MFSPVDIRVDSVASMAVVATPLAPAAAGLEKLPICDWDTILFPKTIVDPAAVCAFSGSTSLYSTDCDDSRGAKPMDETSVTTVDVYVLLAGKLGEDNGAAVMVVAGPLAGVVGPAITLAGCNATGGS